MLVPAAWRRPIGTELEAILKRRSFQVEEIGLRIRARGGQPSLAQDERCAQCRQRLRTKKAKRKTAAKTRIATRAPRSAVVRTSVPDGVTDPRTDVVCSVGLTTDTLPSLTLDPHLANSRLPPCTPIGREAKGSVPPSPPYLDHEYPTLCELDRAYDHIIQSNTPRVPSTEVWSHVTFAKTPGSFAGGSEFVRRPTRSNCHSGGDTASSRCRRTTGSRRTVESHCTC